ncbi:MAG: DUF4214 domain-containing protein [Pseudomonadota bacterium]
MEETYLFEAFRIRYAGPDDIPLYFGEVVLELETALDGFTVSSREGDLFDYPGVLRDAETGTEFNAFSITVARISFLEDRQQRTGTYAFVDVENPLTDEIDQTLAVRISGSELPSFQIGEDLLNFLENNNGGLIIEPPGFRAGDFVSFDDVAGQIDEVPGPQQDPTGLSRAEVLDVAFLYGAAFDRMPDENGVNFWIDRLDFGDRSYVEIAEQFTIAEEFIQLYGPLADVTNAAYVTLLYENTLDRISDGGGFDFWVARLDQGLSRAELLIRFAESDEYRGNNPEIFTITEVSPSEWEFVS